MPSPYNLEVEYSCVACGSRSDRPFCNMTDEAVAALEKIKFTGVYPKGSVLFVEGEQPRGVFILCSGRVKLTTSSAEGKTLILKIAEAGEILGMSTAILNKPYEVSAETLSPCQVNTIKRDDFMKFIAEHVEACMHAAEMLSSKYHTAQREIRSLGLSQSTSEKLARLILDWCESQGHDTPDGFRINVLLTHEEIAQMVGTTRETITRLLSDMKRKHIIDIRGSTVIVNDREALAKMVSI